MMDTCPVYTGSLKRCGLQEVLRSSKYMMVAHRKTGVDRRALSACALGGRIVASGSKDTKGDDSR